MGAVTITESIAIETAAMANGWSEEQLLDLAGAQLGRAIGRFFPQPGTVVGYLGKGHNAGDTLVALRILRDEFRWKIVVRTAHLSSEWAPLCRKKWDELGIRQAADRPLCPWDFEGPLVLLDGLLGSGSRGSLREPLVRLADEMAALRQQAGARVAAVDLPSGIDPDTGRILPSTVVADITFMIGNAKCGLLNGHAAAATGALALVPVLPLTSGSSGAFELIAPQSQDFAKEPRPFDFHKGQAGRVAILAGSGAYSGAAVLAATGALRGGAGLVTLHVPHSISALIAAKCPAEVIVRGFGDPRELSESRFNSLVVGCGLGPMNESIEDAILELIANTLVPTVIDADALNLVAKRGMTGVLSEMHVLTPHPGEFATLAGDLSDLPREEAARRFTERIPATLLLKGSRTIVAGTGRPIRCNSTGTPAMACGGQGDLLAGVIGARLAIGDSPMDAAALGAWICGRSAEIALNEPHLSEDSLLPSDVLHFIGAAFRDWRSCRR